MNMVSPSPKAKIAGLKTQNHDQAITPVSFRTTNAIVNSPKKPMPPDLCVAG